MQTTGDRGRWSLNKTFAPSSSQLRTVLVPLRGNNTVNFTWTWLQGGSCLSLISLKSARYVKSTAGVVLWNVEIPGNTYQWIPNGDLAFPINCDFQRPVRKLLASNSFHCNESLF